MRPRPLSIFLLGLLFLSTLVSASSAILGIDLGQEYIKAALVKPGIPLEIVLTKDTRRKEASAVAFKPVNSPLPSGDEPIYPERLYGADAVNLGARFPQDVYPNLKQLLGKYITDDLVTAYSKRYPSLNIVPSKARGNTVAFRSKTVLTQDAEMSVEELLAMQLKSVIAQAQAMAGPGASRIRDAVFTIPAFFLAEEKYALKVAAELAGLRVISLVTDGLAVGINYATSRTFDEPQYHIVYDMGAGSTTASVLRFEGKSVKDVGRFNKTVQEVSILGLGYDRTLGGDLFNERLEDLILSDFVKSQKGQSALVGEKDPKNVVRSNGRSAAKLWKESTRVRQILSANTDAVASVESLYSDIDFRSEKITRIAFEKTLGEYASRISDPIFDALRKANIKLDEVSSLILHGGAVRTPFVQKKLEEVMGSSEKLSKNVNADEAAVFGATFVGAGESGSFRVKEIHMNDANPYPVALHYVKEAAEKETTQTIFLPGSIVGREKIITIPRTTDLTFKLTHSLLPRKGHTSKIMTEWISTVTSSNLTESVKQLRESFGCEDAIVATKFGISLSKKDSLPIVTRGWVECETEVPEHVKKETEGVLDGMKGMFGFGKKRDEGQVVAEDPVPSLISPAPVSVESFSSSYVVEAETRESGLPSEATLVKKTEKIPVAFTTAKDGFPALTMEDKKLLVSKIKKFDMADDSRRQLEEARNELEGFTYKAREYLSDEGFVAASTEEDRLKFSRLLNEASEWLYGNGFHADIKAVKERMKGLREIADPVDMRKEENSKRPEIVKILRDSIESTKQLYQILESQANVDGAIASAVEVEQELTSKNKLDELEFENSHTSTSTAVAAKPTPKYSAEELATLSKTFHDAEAWLNTREAEQSKLAPYQEPVLRVADIQAKARSINGALMGFLNGKEPRKKMKTRSDFTSNVKERPTGKPLNAEDFMSEQVESRKEKVKKTHDEL